MSQGGWVLQPDEKPVRDVYCPICGQSIREYQPAVMGHLARHQLDGDTKREALKALGMWREPKLPKIPRDRC